jgi:hypothetical protein
MLTGVLFGIVPSSAFDDPGPLFILTFVKEIGELASADDAVTTCVKEKTNATETPATAQRRKSVPVIIDEAERCGKPTLARLL